MFCDRRFLKATDVYYLTLLTIHLTLELSVGQKIKLRVSRQITLSGILLGLGYVAYSNGFNEIYPFVNGGVVGLILGLIISFLELQVFVRGTNKLKFTQLLIIRTLVYVLLVSTVIFLVVAISHVRRLDRTLSEVLNSQEFLWDYVIYGNFRFAVMFALVFAFVINFTRMISRKIGQGMLLSYISGRYYEPVIENRFIMFIKMANSKKLVEGTSDITYHEALKQYYYDITEPIIVHEGIIYEYYDDIVIISWSQERGQRNANVIRCFFEIQEQLERNKEKFVNQYGIAPQIKGALHFGELVRSEIGDLKTQVVFHGDCMNATSRLLDHTIELDKEFMVSNEVIVQIELPILYKAEEGGNVQLRGKSEELHASEIIDRELMEI